MFSKRKILMSCWLIISYIATANLIDASGRLFSLNDNIQNTLFACVLLSVFSLWFTQKMRRLAFQSDLQLLLLSFVGAALALTPLFLALRIPYSLEAFGLFVPLYLTGSGLILAFLKSSRLTIGTFNQQLLGELSSFGDVKLVADVKTAENAKLDYVVGRMNNPDQDEKVFLQKLIIRGRVPVVSRRSFIEFATGQVTSDDLPDLASIHLKDKLAFLQLKNLFDFALSIPIGLVFLVLFLPIALIIKIDSPGPVFFVQKRVGFRGATFSLIKFRTMTDDKNYQKNLGSRDNARITRMGGFLRKSRFDELPQVINVLRGEMSWIGPRPETVKLSKKYAKLVPNFRLRHLVKPGVTGWAQVHQGYTFGEDEFAEKVKFDLYYIKYFSFSLDVLIAFRTLSIILFRTGAR